MIDILGRLRGLAGKLLHLRGHDSKALAGITGPRSFDGGIQGQQVGLRGNTADDAKDLPDLLGCSGQHLNTARGFIDSGSDLQDGVVDLTDSHAAACGRLVSLCRLINGPFAGVSDFLHRSRHFDNGGCDGLGAGTDLAGVSGEVGEVNRHLVDIHNRSGQILQVLEIATALGIAGLPALDACLVGGHGTDHIHKRAAQEGFQSDLQRARPKPALAHQRSDEAHQKPAVSTDIGTRGYSDIGMNLPHPLGMSGPRSPGTDFKTLLQCAACAPLSFSTIPGALT